MACPTAIFPTRCPRRLSPTVITSYSIHYTKLYEALASDDENEGDSESSGDSEGDHSSDTDSTSDSSEEEESESDGDGA